MREEFDRLTRALIEYQTTPSEENLKSIRSGIRWLEDSNQAPELFQARRAHSDTPE